MSNSAESQPQNQTHRQQMGKQNSPIIGVVAALVSVWAGATIAAKELDYKNPREMLRDGWNHAVKALVVTPVCKDGLKPPECK